MRFNNYKRNVFVLALSAAFSICAIPQKSYANLASELAIHLMEHIAAEGGMGILEAITTENQIINNQGISYIIQGPMYGFDYKLGNNSQFVLTPAASGSYSHSYPNRDFIIVAGNSQFINYADISSEKEKDISLRALSAQENLGVESMCAGFLNYGKIVTAGRDIKMKGYDNQAMSVDTLSKGTINPNDLNSVTYDNIMGIIEYAQSHPQVKSYIAYFINANADVYYDGYNSEPLKTPLAGSINSNVDISHGSIFMNVFDADVSASKYTPYVNSITTNSDSSGFIIYNSGHIGSVDFSELNSGAGYGAGILLNDMSHIKDNAGNEISNQQYGTINSVYTNGKALIINNDGATINIFYDTDYNDTVYNFGIINYLNSNATLEGDNRGLISLKTVSGLIDKDMESYNNGTIKNTSFSIAQDYKFHNLGTIKNDTQTLDIKIDEGKFYNESPNSLISNAYIKNSSFGEFNNLGTIENSIISNGTSVTDGAYFYNGTADKHNIVITDTDIINYGHLENYGAINETDKSVNIENNGGVFENHGTMFITNFKNYNDYNSTWLKNYGNLRISGELYNDNARFRHEKGYIQVKKFTNKSSVEINSDTTLHAASIDNSGTFKLNAGARLYDWESPLTITNSKIFDNYTDIEYILKLNNKSGGEFNNNGVIGTIYNFVNDGIFNHNSDSEIKSLTITNNGEMNMDKGLISADTIENNGKMSPHRGEIIAHTITNNGEMNADYGLIKADTLTNNNKMSTNTNIGKITAKTITNNGDMTAYLGPINAHIFNNNENFTIEYGILNAREFYNNGHFRNLYGDVVSKEIYNAAGARFINDASIITDFILNDKNGNFESRGTISNSNNGPSIIANFGYFSVGPGNDINSFIINKGEVNNEFFSNNSTLSGVLNLPGGVFNNKDTYIASGLSHNYNGTDYYDNENYGDWYHHDRAQTHFDKNSRNYAVFRNYGTFHNLGSIYSGIFDMDFENYGTLINGDGERANIGTMSSFVNNGTIINKSGGTIATSIQNQSKGIIDNYGLFDNGTILKNKGTINNYADFTINSDISVREKGVFNQYGHLLTFDKENFSFDNSLNLFDNADLDINTTTIFNSAVTADNGNIRINKGVMYLNGSGTDISEDTYIYLPHVSSLYFNDGKLTIDKYDNWEGGIEQNGGELTISDYYYSRGSLSAKSGKLNIEGQFIFDGNDTLIRKEIALDMRENSEINIQRGKLELNENDSWAGTINNSDKLLITGAVNKTGSLTQSVSSAKTEIQNTVFNMSSPNDSITAGELKIGDKHGTKDSVLNISDGVIDAEKTSIFSDAVLKITGGKVVLDNLDGEVNWDGEVVLNGGALAIMDVDSKTGSLTGDYNHEGKDYMSGSLLVKNSSGLTSDEHTLINDSTAKGLLNAFIISDELIIGDTINEVLTLSDTLGWNGDLLTLKTFDSADYSKGGTLNIQANTSTGEIYKTGSERVLYAEGGNINISNNSSFALYTEFDTIGDKVKLNIDAGSNLLIGNTTTSVVIGADDNIAGAVNHNYGILNYIETDLNGGKGILTSKEGLILFGNTTDNKTVILDNSGNNIAKETIVLLPAKTDLNLNQGTYSIDGNDIWNGTITLGGAALNVDGTDSNGTLKANSGTLNLSGSQITLNADSYIKQDTSLNSDADTTINVRGGNLVIDGSNDKYQGAVTLTDGSVGLKDTVFSDMKADGGAINLENSSLNMSDGNFITKNTDLNIDTSSSININTNAYAALNTVDIWQGTINLNGGELSAVGDIIAGTLNGTGGTLIVGDGNEASSLSLTTGSTVIGKDVIVGVNNNSKLAVNEGTVNFNENDIWNGVLEVTNNGILNLSNIDSNGDINALGGKLNISDSKMFLSSGSSIQNAVNLTFANDSTINITGGNVEINTGDVWDGAINLSEGTLSYSGTDKNGSLNVLGGVLNIGNGTDLTILNLNDKENIFSNAQVNIDTNTLMNINGGTAILDANDNWKGSVKLSNGDLMISGVTNNGNLAAVNGNLFIGDGKTKTLVTLDTLNKIANAVNTNIASNSAVQLDKGSIFTFDTSDVLNGEILMNGGTFNFAPKDKEIINIQNSKISGNLGQVNLNYDGANTTKGTLIINTDLSSYLGNTNIKDGTVIAQEDSTFFGGNTTAERGSKLVFNENANLSGKVISDGASIFLNDMVNSDNWKSILSDGQVFDYQNGQIELSSGSSLLINSYTTVKDSDTILIGNSNAVQNLTLIGGARLESNINADNGKLAFNITTPANNVDIILENGSELLLYQTSGNVNAGYDIKGDNSSKIILNNGLKADLFGDYSGFNGELKLDTAEINLTGNAKMFNGNINADIKDGSASMISNKSYNRDISFNELNKKGGTFILLNNGNTTVRNNINADGDLTFGTALNVDGFSNITNSNMQLWNTANFNNTLTTANSTVNMLNGQINTVNMNNGWKLGSDSYFKADISNFANDLITASNISSNDGNQRNLLLTGVNYIGVPKSTSFSTKFIDGEIDESVIVGTDENLSYNTPLGTYRMSYGGNGMFNSNLVNFAPSLFASSVGAQVGSYLTQLNNYETAFGTMDQTMLMTRKMRDAMKLKNKYASAGSPNPMVFSPTYIPEENKGLWYRPYVAFERVGLNNGPSVDNTMYGNLFGADSEIIELPHGWDAIFSAYAGYNGSHQSYQGNSIYQNGGVLGLTGFFYKGNFFSGVTVNAGANLAEASSMYGSENFAMLTTGIANKTGYNFELLNEKLIIQPSLLMSYTFVNTFDYKNASGISIKSSPLNAIQLAPGIKIIGNLKNGWQPYAGVSVVWNIMDETKFSANDISLPQMSIRPYVQYGVGVQRRWADKFTAFGQIMIRNGGRDGVAFQFGLRMAIGKSKK